MLRSNTEPFVSNYLKSAIDVPIHATSSPPVPITDTCSQMGICLQSIIFNYMVLYEDLDDCFKKFMTNYNILQNMDEFDLYKYIRPDDNTVKALSLQFNGMNVNQINVTTIENTVGGVVKLPDEFTGMQLYSYVHCVRLRESIRS